MQRKALIFFSLLISISYASQAAVKSETKASRPPRPNCQWKPFEAKELGIRILVEDCSTVGAYIFSVKGTTIEQHRPSDDRTFGGPVMLEVFEKSASQSIRDAIKERFLAKKEKKVKEGCVIVPTQEARKKKGVEFYTIVPSGMYEKEIMKDLQNGPRDFGCSAYGKDQQTTYLEYHPNESKTRFIWVGFWDEHPLFDEDSVYFLK